MYPEKVFLKEVYSIRFVFEEEKSIKPGQWQ